MQLHIAGQLAIPLEEFTQRFQNIRGFISDWDGVFNNGIKAHSLPSVYAEADSMGLNLLRYAFWLKNQVLPPFAIITGADNPSAIDLAKREHFSAVYSKIVNKGEAVLHFCENNQLQPHEVACFFDDANDLAMARLCGVRFLIQRKASEIFNQIVIKNHLCDYISQNEGGNYALREICELLLQLEGNFEKILLSRANFDSVYQQYFSLRQSLPTKFFNKSQTAIDEISLLFE